MNFLLHINKVIKRKIFIEYIILDKIIYNNQQLELKNLIDYVAETNFVFLRETEVIKCNTSIVLYLKYKDKAQCFNLSEQR